MSSASLSQLSKALKVSCQACSLSELCLPRGLDDKELQQLDSLVERPLPMHNGDMLYQPEDEFGNLFAIRSGCVKTYMLGKNGEEMILGFHLPGEILGLDGLESGRHSVYAVALDTSSVCTLPYNRFDHLCEHLPNLRSQLHSLIGKEINQEHQHLMLLGSLTAEERLATFLISLSSRYEKRGFSATEFNLSMSRHDIGRYLGLAVETVSRLFSGFQDQGLLEVNRKNIRITNLDALKSLLETCNED